MDLWKPNRAVLALLVVCSALLVTSSSAARPRRSSCWGNGDYRRVSQTPEATGYTAVAAGGIHSLALRAAVPPSPFTQPAD